MVAAYSEVVKEIVHKGVTIRLNLIAQRAGDIADQTDRHGT